MLVGSQRLCRISQRKIGLNHQPISGFPAFVTPDGSLADSPLIQEAYDLNIPVMTFPGKGGEASLFSISAPNIVLETVKLAEDGSGDVILRLYEAKRMATRCVLTTTLPVEGASLANMLEEGEADLMIENGHLGLDFRAFEIKTIRLKVNQKTEKKAQPR